MKTRIKNGAFRAAARSLSAKELPARPKVFLHEVTAELVLRAQGLSATVAGTQNVHVKRSAKKGAFLAQSIETQLVETVFRFAEFRRKVVNFPVPASKSLLESMQGFQKSPK